MFKLNGGSGLKLIHRSTQKRHLLVNANTGVFAVPTGPGWAVAGMRTEGRENTPPGRRHIHTTIVRDLATAHRVLPFLQQPGVTWACDTEVEDIDLKQHGPVGHGRVTCVSICGGDGVHFGEGADETTNSSVLWIENIGSGGGDEAQGLLQEFKGWFEDDKCKKVF